MNMSNPSDDPVTGLVFIESPHGSREAGESAMLETKDAALVLGSNMGFGVHIAHKELWPFFGIE